MKMRWMESARRAAAALAAWTLAGCASAPRLGADAPVAAGAVGGSNPLEASAQLQRCDAPLGTVALFEEDNARAALVRASLDSFVPVLRLMVQQSNCFVVVERGRAFANLDFERKLAAGDALRDGSAAAGKLLAADYTMLPSVTFAEPSGFGMTTGLGGLFGRGGRNVDASAQIQAQGASTTLLLVDNASGAQIVAAQGSARNYNLGAGVGVLGGLLAGVNATFDTPQGKVVVAAFLDAYNKLVAAARRYAPQKAQGEVGRGGVLKGP
jgi:curli biogenesis system outer membrane secretion channel CsgG